MSDEHDSRNHTMNSDMNYIHPLDGLTHDRATQLIERDRPFTPVSYKNICDRVAAEMAKQRQVGQPMLQQDVQHDPSPVLNPSFQSDVKSNSPDAQPNSDQPKHKRHLWHYLLAAALSIALIAMVGFVALDPNIGIWRNWLSNTTDAGETGVDALNAAITPIGSYVDDQGIRVELTSAVCDGEATYYMFKVTDLEGDRLGNQILLDCVVEAPKIDERMLNSDDGYNQSNAVTYVRCGGSGYQVGYNESDHSIDFVIEGDGDLAGKNVNICVTGITPYGSSESSESKEGITGFWNFSYLLDSYAEVADTGQVNIDTPSGRVFNAVVSPISINLYHQVSDNYDPDAPLVEIGLVYEDEIVPVKWSESSSAIYSGRRILDDGSVIYDGYTGDKELEYANVLDPYNDEFVGRFTCNVLVDHLDELKAISVNGVEIPILYLYTPDPPEIDYSVVANPITNWMGAVTEDGKEGYMKRSDLAAAKQKSWKDHERPVEERLEEAIQIYTDSAKDMLGIDALDRETAEFYFFHHVISEEKHEADLKMGNSFVGAIKDAYLRGEIDDAKLEEYRDLEYIEFEANDSGIDLDSIRPAKYVVDKWGGWVNAVASTCIPVYDEDYETVIGYSKMPWI